MCKSFPVWKHLCKKRWEEVRRVGKSWEELTRGDKSWDELRKRWDQLSGGETRWEELRRGGTGWEELRWVEKGWEEVGRGESRWEELRKAGKRPGRGEKSWEVGRDEKLWELLKRVVKSWEELRWSEKSCEELRSGGHSWKGVRQDEDEFTEQSWENVRLHSSSYRQTLSLDPIASQSLNLETSATRLARVLLIYCMHIMYIWKQSHSHHDWLIMGTFDADAEKRCRPFYEISPQALEVTQHVELPERCCTAELPADNHLEPPATILWKGTETAIAIGIGCREGCFQERLPNILGASRVNVSNWTWSACVVTTQGDSHDSQGDHIQGMQVGLICQLASLALHAACYSSSLHATCL